MSSAYDNDSRVVKVSDSEYRIKESDKNCGWTVREEDGVWNAYNPRGEASRIACGLSTANSAIAEVLGDSR